MGLKSTMDQLRCRVPSVAVLMLAPSAWRLEYERGTVASTVATKGTWMTVETVCICPSPPR